jgi:protein-disulfide isomerase
MKNPWIFVLVLAVVLIGASVWYSQGVAEKNNAGIEFTPHIKGNPDASVTLTEYSDLQCPACAAFQPYVNDVMDTYGDSVRFEYKHFPLPIHNLAEPAGRAAEAAGLQGQFFPYVDLLFVNQKTWSVSPNPTSFFIKYAEELGLDIDTFKRQMNASLVRDKIKEDRKAASEKDITGTPTFFLNGKKMQIETYENFREQIESAINPAVEFTVPQ